MKTIAILCAAFLALPVFATENNSPEKTAAAAIENLPISLSMEEDRALKAELSALLERLNKKMTTEDLKKIDADLTKIMKKMAHYIAAVSPEDMALEQQIASDAAKLSGKNFERKYKKLNDEVNALLARSASFSEYTPDQRAFVGATLKINLTSTQGIAAAVKESLAKMEKSNESAKSPESAQKKP